MTDTFAQFGLPDDLVATLSRRGIDRPFPIQAAAIPDALAGSDVSGEAPTGSGKTLAFGLPILVRVGRARAHRPRALILAPTRELAEQIKRELDPLATSVRHRIAAVYGGVSYGPQRSALRRGVEVLVATPGRLEDLIDQGTIDLGEIEIVVVDEADRMADMGFLPAVRRILDQTPAVRQTLLFSATLDGDVAVLSRDYQRDPIRHDAGTVAAETTDALHHFWHVDHADRVRHTADLIDASSRTIVFTRTRRGADRLTKRLTQLGIDAVPIHGGRSQNQRGRALKSFSSGRASALVATDVAARGIHVDDVESVVHFDPPNDAKDYVHRSGRTARAGASGTVVSLVTGDQRRAVVRLQQDLDLDAPIGEPAIESLDSGGHRLGDVRPSPPPKGRRRERTRRTDGAPRRKARSHAGGTTSLYVANLPWSIDSDDLRQVFERHGTVHEATIITDRRGQRSRGFGFVAMPDDQARAAIDALSGSDLGGRDMTVRPAKPSARR